MKLHTLIGIFVAIIVPVAFFLYFDGQGVPKRPKLKRFIALEEGSTQANQIKVKDTIWHTIPPFSFMAQTGKTVTEKDFRGKITVADFFFTNCQGICPKMSTQLTRVQKTFKDYPDVRLLSHTVDPERDDVATLKHYADMYGADSTKWFLVTGNKKKIYEQARYGYFVTATEGDGGPEDFIHTEKFILIDPQGVIRGYYDGTDSLAVDKLMGDIIVLQIEFPNDRKKLSLKPQ